MGNIKKTRFHKENTPYTKDSHKTKSTRKNKNEDISNYFKKIDIDLATLEKIGCAFLTVGYLQFILGADLDIKETLEINNTGLKSTAVTLNGSELILIGYFLLFIVAYDRFYEKLDENIVSQVLEEFKSVLNDI